MCRWIFYAGPELAIADLITRPEHSLIHQSFHSRHRDEPLNGDGFGLAWYPKDGQAPAAFRSIQPAWNDSNLRDLARVTSSSTILAHVRAATPGLGVSQYNCHPFTAGHLSFMHNGVLGDFLRLKRRLLHELTDAQFDRLMGTTDSEHIFGLVLDSLEGESLDDLARALVTTIRRLEKLQSDVGTTEHNTFNFCLSNGLETAMCRYSRGKRAESLFLHQGARYLCDGDKCIMLPAGPGEPGAVLVASEPLGSDENWQEIEPGQLVLIREDRSVELRALP